MSRKRIVITGLGMVTPIGNSVEENWKSILDGKSGANNITRFDVSDFPVKIAAEVKNFDPENYVDKKDVKKFDLFIFYALAAATEAFNSSGLAESGFDPYRVGVAIGSGIGGFYTIEQSHETIMTAGTRRVSPFFIPSAIINMANGLVSIKFQLKGPNISIVTACATGTHSIGDAARIIERGDADVMLAGGTEAAVTPLSVAGFSNMRALSRRNDEPQKASRPFDKNRDGFLVGEGAGVVVLESLEHATARGAKIYGEVVGYGMTGDAYHITMPDETGDGASRCMTLALNDANISVEDIGYINAHGTSTPFNDVIETRAMKKVFGDHAYKVKISSTKSMTGHLLGAAGAVEGIYSLLALNNSLVPATLNLDTPDEECDLDYTPKVNGKLDAEYALSNSFGFGGTNATLVFKKYVG